MSAKATVGFLGRNLDQESLKREISLALEQVFSDPEQIPTLFTDDYVQTTDGKTSNRQEFEEHIRHVVRTVESIRFEILEVVQQGSSLADRHLVHVAYEDGRIATIEIYLFGTVFEGRLRRVHEVSRVVSGAEELREMATARS